MMAANTAARVALIQCTAALSGDAAVEALGLYVSGFSGAYFESMGRPLASSGAEDPEPDAFTVEDALAPSLLSAPLKPEQILALLRANGDLSPLLEAVGVDTPLAQAEDYDPGSPSRRWEAARDAYAMLRSIDGVGRTRATKLLHRKRPHLLPVWDSVVSTALRYGRADDWAVMQTVMRDPKLTARLHSIRKDARADSRIGGRVDQLSDLRLIDIIVWMRAGGAGIEPATTRERLLVPELTTTILDEENV
jgi:hypothetical protein